MTGPVELVVLAVRAGLLALLWLFVLTAVLVVRRDLAAARPGDPARPRPPRPSAEPRPQPPRRTPPRRAAQRLVVVEGPLAGTSLPLGDTPVTVGRGDGCTLVLSDEYVSSRHARLVPSDGEWLVEDAGSTNGTYVDGARVGGPTPVGVGRRIRIGRTVLELRR